jgi:hypothetical protein
MSDPIRYPESPPDDASPSQIMRYLDAVDDYFTLLGLKRISDSRE